ncbi:MAG: hypothetical protein H0U88_01035 [Chthoniobacterales bacterium]|nr:hypothetical protein [Chthoniobacterales bacterium]
MKKHLLFAALFAALSSTGSGGSVETNFVADTETENPALDLFSVDASYVFESKLSFDDDDNFGDQDALQTSIEYSHRFRLSGSLYLRAGLAYNRFDFGQSSAPVPDQLHSLAAIVGIDYMVGNDVGAFLQLRPGFYAEDDFDGDSFDVPITLARIWVLQPKRLYLLTGVNVAFLRGQLPVLPILGLIWYPSDNWKVFAVVPEPRIVYSPNKNIGLWLGGQLTGGSFRTDHSDTIFPRKLSGAQVDYSEYRAGLGVDFRCGDAVTLTAAGGYAIQRRFNFERAGDDYDTDPAPYARLSLKAEF